MKWIFTIFLFLTITAFAQDEPIDTDGDGYRNISTLEQLRWISENDSSWSWSFELDNDIDAADTKNWNVGDHDENTETPDSAMGWIPIGTRENPFTGDFNGNGFAIDGLYSNRLDAYVVSLISNFNSGKISNLKITNCELTGKYVASIVGENRGIIKNCFSSGNMKAYESAAGIAVSNFRLIDSCKSEVSITAWNYVGGITGLNRGEVSNTSFTGNIFTKDRYCGGIVGYNHGLVINNNVESEIVGGSVVGGIAGFNFGFVNACKSSGFVKANKSAGGICGSDANTIKNSSSFVYVEGNEYVGGIVGRGNKLINCFSCSDVKGDTLFGALNGDSTTLVINSYWNKDSTELDNFAGGIGITTIELNDKSSFKDWNFDYVWVIDTSYPYIEIKYENALKDSDNDGYLEINNVKDFEWMSETGLNCNQNIELTNNINMSESTLYNDTFGFRTIPIYSGKIKGNNYTIDSLRINSFNATNVGLFAQIEDSHIENITIKNATIKGKRYVGVIAGKIMGTNINNCKIDGKISCSNEGGGIAGFLVPNIYSYNTIDSCEIIIEIEGQDNIGGVAGKIYGIIFKNSIVNSRIKGNNYVGGISGQASIICINNEINSKVIGNVYVGGVFGFQDTDSELSAVTKDCSIIVDVKGQDLIGGIAGESWSLIDSCSVTGEVSGNEHVGGIVGDNWNKILFSNFSGEVSGNSRIGGVSGRNIGIIESCRSNSIVTGNSVVGGLVGYNSVAEVYNCFSIGEVSGNKYIGGLIGNIFMVNYWDPYYYSKISNSFSRSEVNGQDKIGGFSGNMQGSCNEVINCYSTGTVNGDTNLGGFIGENFHLEFVENSFFDLETSQIDSSAGGTGKTTAEMKTKSTFTEADWDFDEIWFISEDVNDGYPALFGMDNPVTSVSDEMIKNFDYITISPNPATDYIEISLNSHRDSNGACPLVSSDKIAISNLLGERVLSESIHPMTPIYRMNVANLPKGVYFIRIGDKTEKFVKK